MQGSGNDAQAARNEWSGTAHTNDWTADWGRLLRTARQVAGLSLTELSARTELSKGYLSKLESGAAGAANPSRATLAALVRALPSFGPVAHMLGPEGAREALDFAASTHRPSPMLRVVASPATDPGVPMALGWRELEVFTGLAALDSAALPVRLTAVVISRAVRRDAQEVKPVLERLREMGLVDRHPPTAAGGQPSYTCAEDAQTRLGVAKLGDLLILAAALIAGTSAAQGKQDGRIPRAPRAALNNLESDAD